MRHESTESPASRRFLPTAALCLAIFVSLAIPCELFAIGTLTARPSGSVPGTSVGYYEYVPEAYGDDPGFLYPIILFFHGSGETGNGSADHLSRLLATGLPQLLNQGNWPATPAGGEQEPDRFVILSPQSSGGFPNSSVINDFIDFALSEYQADPERVYLTGLSAGGITIFNYLSNNYSNSLPDRVAATLPIAGSGSGTIPNACLYKHIPIWAFHGDNDMTVFPSGSINTIAAVNDCDPPPPEGNAKVTIFPGGGHSGDVWNRVWNLSRIGTEDPTFDPFDGSIYEWLLQYRRGGMLAQEIFADGFETGDIAAWTVFP